MIFNTNTFDSIINLKIIIMNTKDSKSGDAGKKTSTTKSADQKAGKDDGKTAVKKSPAKK
jgi:hypothetical protein